MHLLGAWSSIVLVIIDFLREQTKQVNIYNQKSEVLNLIWGGPQGSIIRQLLYIKASNDVIEDVTKEDKFKYIDEL